MLATSQKKADADGSFNTRIELPQRRSAQPFPSTPSAAPLWTARQTDAARRGSACRARCTALNAVRPRSTANAPALRSASLCHVRRLRSGGSGSCATTDCWARRLRPKNGAGLEADGRHGPGLRQAGRERRLTMDACVMCRRKVQPAENWLKCHLWGGFAMFTGDALASICAPRASSKSRASSGKRAAMLRRSNGRPSKERSDENEMQGSTARKWRGPNYVWA